MVCKNVNYIAVVLAILYVFYQNKTAKVLTEQRKIITFATILLNTNKKNVIQNMKELVKYLGVVLILIGVVIFIIYSQTVGGGNGYLWGGLTCVILGFIAHIYLNKYIK